MEIIAKGLDFQTTVQGHYDKIKQNKWYGKKIKVAHSSDNHLFVVIRINLFQQILAKICKQYLNKKLSGKNFKLLSDREIGNRLKKLSESTIPKKETPQTTTQNPEATPQVNPTDQASPKTPQQTTPSTVSQPEKKPTTAPLSTPKIVTQTPPPRKSFTDLPEHDKFEIAFRGLYPNSKLLNVSVISDYAEKFKEFLTNETKQDKFHSGSTPFTTGVGSITCRLDDVSSDLDKEGTEAVLRWMVLNNQVNAYEPVANHFKVYLAKPDSYSKLCFNTERIYEIDKYMQSFIYPDSTSEFTAEEDSYLKKLIKELQDYSYTRIRLNRFHPIKFITNNPAEKTYTKVLDYLVKAGTIYAWTITDNKIRAMYAAQDDLSDVIQYTYKGTWRTIKTLEEEETYQRTHQVSLNPSLNIPSSLQADHIQAILGLINQRVIPSPIEITHPLMLTNEADYLEFLKNNGLIHKYETIRVKGYRVWPFKGDREAHFKIKNQYHPNPQTAAKLEEPVRNEIYKFIQLWNQRTKPEAIKYAPVSEVDSFEGAVREFGFDINKISNNEFIIYRSYSELASYFKKHYSYKDHPELTKTLGINAHYSTYLTDLIKIFNSRSSPKPVEWSGDSKMDHEATLDFLNQLVNKQWIHSFETRNLLQEKFYLIYPNVIDEAVSKKN